MRYRVGIGTIGEATVSSLSISAPPEAFYSWKVEVVGVKTWNVGCGDCPITSGSFTVGTYGMGKASLTFAEFPVPITTKDRVRIYRKGSKRHEGFVASEPQNTGGKVSISPNSKNFEWTLFNFDYSTQVTGYQDIIEDVLVDSADVTGVLYNASMLNINSTEQITPNYEYATVKTVLREVSEQLDDRYAGVEENSFYYIRKFSTSIGSIIYSDDDQAYSDLSVKVDDSKIKATRYRVYQKSTTGNNSVFIGSVGYDDEYPSLSIENRIGIREQKISVPQGLINTPSSKSQALDYAYAQLISKTDVPTNIKIKNLDLNRYDLTIGDYIRVYQPEAQIWNTIIDCESTSNWTQNANLSTVAKKDTYSISYDSGNAITYTFNNLTRWKKLSKVGFYIRSNRMGSHVSFNVANASRAWGMYSYSEGNYSVNSTNSSAIIWSTAFTNVVYINTVNHWQWVDFPIELDDFRYISFKSNDTDATIYIDNISLFQYHRAYYDANVIEVNYNLESDVCNVTAGIFDESLNDDFFTFQKKVEKLEEVTQE